MNDFDTDRIGHAFLMLRFLNLFYLLPPVDTKEDHDILVFLIVVHVCSVYPSTMAAILSVVLRVVHAFDADCGWVCAILSHKAWVYPSNFSA